MNRGSLVVSDLQVLDASGRTIVEPVSFEVHPDRPVAIVGESGSGKSLIAQAIMGLLPEGFKAIGNVSFLGQAPIRLADRPGLRSQWGRTVTLIPQEPSTALDPIMRVGRQLGFVRGATKSCVRSAFTAVDLPRGTTQSLPHTLSGGMAQRVLIAEALLTSAPIVIADEPTKGLDPARTQQVATLLGELKVAGRPLLIITHDLSLARALEGDTIVLREGTVVDRGGASEILVKGGHPYTRALIAADPSSWKASRSAWSDGAPVLEAENLTFGYPGKQPLFRDVSFTVSGGQILAISGPSGRGKSTLGNVLLGLARPQTGRVLWGNADLYRDTTARKRLRSRYQKLHQDPITVFAPHRTLGSHLIDVARLVGLRDATDGLHELLSRVGLSPNLMNRFPHEVSGGEAQRIALARILLMKPDLIVADEPTSRLDPIIQRATLDLLQTVQRGSQIGIVLISHNPDIVRSLADEHVTL